jgi:hypothetical protein
MQASYYDPDKEETIQVDHCEIEDLFGLMHRVVQLQSGRGHPTLELRRGDGSSLSFSTDGKRAFLVFINSLGESFHGVGDGDGPDLVFDYFGSWSEASAESLVPLEDARESLVSYASTGIADTARVLFEPE